MKYCNANFIPVHWELRSALLFWRAKSGQLDFFHLKVPSQEESGGRQIYDPRVQPRCLSSQSPTSFLRKSHGNSFQFSSCFFNLYRHSCFFLIQYLYLQSEVRDTIKPDQKVITAFGPSWVRLLSNPKCKYWQFVAYCPQYFLSAAPASRTLN